MTQGISDRFWQAEARIKTDKISADILCDLLRSNLLPEAYVPHRETREAKNILTQRALELAVEYPFR